MIPHAFGPANLHFELAGLRAIPGNAELEGQE